MKSPVKNSLVLAVFFFAAIQTGLGRQPAPAASLKELLQRAEKNYPLLKAKAFEVQAAQKNVTTNKNTIIPSLDAAYQLNYATYNNITGMAVSQGWVPISGPPATTNNMNGVFGSAAGLLLNWQAVTFGQRQAQVELAQSGVQYASADAQNEIFQHKVKVINAYLDVLTAAELVKVYEENCRRTEANLSVIRTLVANGIKPGVDSALLRSEISRARVDLLNGHKIQEQSVILLSQFLATDSAFAITDSSYFNKLPVSPALTADSIKNPVLSIFQSSIELNRLKRKMLSTTTMPTLGVWSTVYARGSGVAYDGTVKRTDGLAFQRYNYGIGVQINIPILQFARLKPQIQQQELLIRSGEEKLNDISLQLKKQNQMADTALQTAFAVAKEGPVFYESAAFAYKALLSRYQSGLVNFADLIQAQYALVKAQIDLKTAYMAVWKALLFKAAITGDLNLFLNQVN